MNEHTITAIVSVLLAIIGVAILSVLVSGNSATSGVIQAGGGGIAQMISCALSPVTGGGCGTNVSSSVTFGNGLLPGRR